VVRPLPTSCSNDPAPDNRPPARARESNRFPANDRANCRVNGRGNSQDNGLVSEIGPVSEIDRANCPATGLDDPSVPNALNALSVLNDPSAPNGLISATTCLRASRTVGIAKSGAMIGATRFETMSATIILVGTSGRIIRIGGAGRGTGRIVGRLGAR